MPRVAERIVSKGLHLCEEGCDECELVNSSVAQLHYIEEILNGYISLLDEADKIAAKFPKEYREAIETRAAVDVNAEIHLFAGALAGVSKIARDEMRAKMDIALSLQSQLSKAITDGYKCPPSSSEDTQLIVGFIRFISGLGSRSKRQLLTFLQTSPEGGTGYATLYTSGREKREARHSYELNQKSKDELRLTD